MKDMRSEADVKKLVKAELSSWGTEIWWFMPAANGFGTPGIPDFVCSYRGHALTIETKFDKGTQTAWQKKQMGLIRESLTPYWLIDEKSVLDFPVTLRNWMSTCS